jgi:hypothetical protein
MADGRNNIILQKCNITAHYLCISKNLLHLWEFFVLQNKWDWFANYQNKSINVMNKEKESQIIAERQQFL